VVDDDGVINVVQVALIFAPAFQIVLTVEAMLVFGIIIDIQRPPFLTTNDRWLLNRTKVCNLRRVDGWGGQAGPIGIVVVE
jgi:hypothetical protein